MDELRVRSAHRHLLKVDQNNFNINWDKIKKYEHFIEYLFLWLRSP